MGEPYFKSYRPGPFLPSTSFTGEESPLILRAENIWLRYARSGSVYAESYSGSQSLSETISTKTLTGTLAWTNTTKVVTGTGTLFASELHLGSFVIADGGAGLTELLVVENILSDTSFTCSKVPSAAASGKTGYVMPVIFPVGNDRGTAIRGKVLRYPRGHYIGVGDGTFAINGTTTLGSGGTLALSRTPQFALYNPTTDQYTQNDVGIDKPLVPPTLTAITPGASYRTITGATNANPIVVTTGNDHLLYTGQEVVISGVTGNTAANGTWTITVLTSTTFSIPIAGNGAYVAGGTITAKTSVMRAGDYNIRICNANTTTLGFSNPSDAVAPVTLANNQWIKVTFNTAMLSDQDAYDIYGSAFLDGTTNEYRYNGPWFKVATITKENLQATATPLGTETATYVHISYGDGEISAATDILTFNNFAPFDAEFVDIINGFPIYFSCQGKDVGSRKNTSPGPAAVPSKPSNPEAIFKDKTITTSTGDYIVGQFSAKSRIFALGQNSLQTLILTSIDEEPITFRSLWDCGFRNPYNVAFVKDYLYGMSTHKIVRSVAGGDDTAMEFEFASDVRDYIVNWPCGHILTSYDPKNRAVVFFYAAAERRTQSGTAYWVTIALPFLIDKGIWNPPIVLSLPTQDCIVSGVATVGENLVFVAGGRTSGGSINVGTYVFDGGDSSSKSWYIAWNFSHDGTLNTGSTLKGGSVTGKFTGGTGATMKVYGLQKIGSLDAFDFDSLYAGTNAQVSFVFGSTGAHPLARKHWNFWDFGPYPMYTLRVEGSTTGTDRFDQLMVKLEKNDVEF